jgi:ribosomal protein S18 acetylase RimI-like enzyme
MDRSLAQLVHRNLIEVSARSTADSGGTVESENGALLLAARSPMPFLNIVVREGPGASAAGLLESARAFFFERGRGFVVYTWPGDPELGQAASSAGMFPILERYPEMVCHAPLQPLPGDVRPVADLEDAAAYWRICDQAYPSLGFPPGLFTEAFDPRLLLDEQWVWACVARIDQRPVACASVYLAGGVGFVGWVAALPDARGQGLAAACTVLATNRAFELGADVASLQASSMGESIYRRLGYEELFAYRLLGAMPEPA